MMKTLLYWPGARIIDPSRWGGFAPDLLIIDLEESVAMQDRATARASLLEQCNRLASFDVIVAVRLCDASGHDAELDLEAIARLPEHVGIVVPKPLTVTALARLPVDRPLWLMTEQPGVAHELPTLCSIASVDGFIVGLKDMCDALGVTVDPADPYYRRECKAIIDVAQTLAKPVFGGVLLGDELAIIKGYHDARNFGFDGVSLISSRHVEVLEECSKKIAV
jgi:citrate lyase beta subunit